MTWFADTCYGAEQRNVVYTRLQRLLRDQCPEPGSALRALARISAFNLFITTTFDPLLENALNAERYGGQPMTQRLAFFPEAALKDLPARKADLSRASSSLRTGMLLSFYPTLFSSHSTRACKCGRCTTSLFHD